jgi:hypothetical protein
MSDSPSKKLTRIDPPESPAEVPRDADVHCAIEAVEQQAGDPSPEQIEHRAAQIRNQWSDRVKKKRYLRAPVRWSVPQVPIAEIDFS